MRVGDQIGHYSVVEHIGRGGMADVWSARDAHLERTVAIKTIVANLTDDRTRVQFEHEARTIAALEHSNILPVYDFGEFERQLYIVMRYIAGGSLLDRIIDVGWLPDDDVIRIAESLALALERAHAENIVHRDLKPANVLLDRFGTPYLADFGLAAVAGAGDEETASAGTLMYMPPEQMFGEPVDHRADIYAFAIMLFQMITGEFPFEGQAALCLQQVQKGEQLPDPRMFRQTLPEQVATVLRIATAVDVQTRFDSARMLVAELAFAMQNGGQTAVAGQPQQAGADFDAVPHLMETGAAVDGDLMETVVGLVGDDLLDTAPVDSAAIAAGFAAGEAAQPPDEDVPSSLEDVRQLYQRMVRAWGHGQGRFLTGATYFASIHSYYARPEVHGLTIDAAGREAILRGAVEHGYELDFWLEQVPDVDTRRIVFLHALRSDAPGARALAVRLLVDIPDSASTVIATTVARLLHSETSIDVRREIVALLAHRGESAAVWREVAFNLDTDLLLAEQALRTDAPDVAELAARTIGRLRAQAAALHIAAQEADHSTQVRKALFWMRDEADQLPPETPQHLRRHAFARLTSHYLTTNIGRLGLRFLLALIGTGLGLAWWRTVMFPSSNILMLENLYAAVANGQTFGLVAGLGITLAAALPLRLAGSSARQPNGAVLWRGWARLLAGIVVGGVIGLIAYLNFQILALNYYDPTLWVLLLGGLGLSLGAALAGTLRWPLWARLVSVLASVFGALWLAWRVNGVTDAIIPLRGDDQIYLYVMMGFLAALGVWGPEIIDVLRGLRGRSG